MDAAQDNGQAMSIAEAARLLGASPEAVRKRVRRGTLEAYKLDGEWRVVLSHRSESGGDNGQAVGRADTRHDGQDAAQDGDLRHRIAVLEAVLAQVTSERDYLRQAHAAALAKIPELPATATPATGPTAATSTSRRRWWQFWAPGQTTA